MSEFEYNQDLLLKDSIRRDAANSYPDIFPALDHKALRDRFARVNDQANRLKASSRRWGIASIALVTIALTGASSAPLFEHWPGARYVAGLAALAGIAGVLIGGFGVLHTGRKKRWLWHRFETERLRQFFFQTQAVFAPEIVGAAQSGQWGHFHALRAASFAQLEQMLDSRLKAEFDLALKDDLGATIPAGRWIVRRAGPAPRVPGSPAAAQLKEAYRHLRLNGQRVFAEHKIEETGAWFSKQPADQVRLIAWLGGGAIMLSVLLHVLLAAIVSGAWSGPPVAWLHIGAIWLAILAIAVRTVDEGLQPGREVERYRAYRDAARNILDRFDRAKTMAGSLQAMREMEELSYDETVAFLKSNKKASFAI